MWKTAILLIVTLILVPVLTFYLDEPLTMQQLDVLYLLLKIYGTAALLCFIVSSVTQNYSQVDKLWSIIPIPYVWVVAVHSGFEPRIVLMAILVTIWAIRLTYNFGRRGGYSIKFWEGHEDYRWAILQQKPGLQQKWKWMLFNFFFISGYQMGLILLFTLPALKSMNSAQPLGILDFILTAAFLFFVVFEFIADQQQYNYQNEKYRQIESGKVEPNYETGFVHTGLWAYSRHPNYFAEQAIWIVFYLFSIQATGIFINWSIAGAILLVLLFYGSSNFSESISARKYPLYSKYQKEVGRFFPLKGKFKV